MEVQAQNLTVGMKVLWGEKTFTVDRIDPDPTNERRVLVTLSGIDYAFYRGKVFGLIPTTDSTNRYNEMDSQAVAEKLRSTDVGDDMNLRRRAAFLLELHAPKEPIQDTPERMAAGLAIRKLIEAGAALSNIDRGDIAAGMSKIVDTLQAEFFPEQLTELEMAPEDVPACFASEGGYGCTRPLDHDGPHAAHGEEQRRAS